MYAPTNLTAERGGGDPFHEHYLTWQNFVSYDFVLIEHSENDIDWTEIANLDGTATSWLDTGIPDGKKFYYRVRNYDSYAGYSSYSEEANAITYMHRITGLVGQCLSPASIKIDWTNEASCATNIRIWMSGAVIDTVVATQTTYTKSGLTAATWYYFSVQCYNADIEAAYADDIQVFTTDPPNAPSNLQGQATGTDKAQLSFQDNSDNETSFRIMYYPPGGPWSEWGSVGAGVTTATITGLTTDTAYSFLVKARGDGGDSDYSNQVNIVTWADIAQPTQLQTFAANDTVGDLIFQDNSNAEDCHCVERSTDANNYSEIVQLGANRTFYRMTGLVKGQQYWIKVRAKQGANYSSYSDVANFTTISEPAAPSNLAISELQDATLRLAWTPSANATKYGIEKSANGVVYTEIIQVENESNNYQVTGLTAATQYWFRVRAGDAAGWSNYCAAANNTMLSAYAPSNFENLIRKTSLKLVTLAEINIKMPITGWSAANGMNYTYQANFAERGAEIEDCLENANKYTAKNDVANVEATVSSYWHDSANGLIYVHTSSNNSADNFLIEGKFWLYFTNWKTVAHPMVFNNHQYLPLLSKSNVPETSQEIKPLYEGTMSASGGTLGIFNGNVGGEKYFDKKYALYTWEGAKVVIKAGGENFSYSDYVTIYTGVVQEKPQLTDRLITLSLGDMRDYINRELPANLFWATEYPLLDVNSAEFKPKPILNGTVVKAPAVCVDTSAKKWMFHDGRCKSVQNVYRNDSALVENTDYFVDLRRGIIEFAEAFDVTTSDVITVSFHGAVDDADEEITDGSMIFKHLLMDRLGCAAADLDLDSIYAMKLNNPKTLSLYLNEQKPSSEVFRNIERSLRGYSYQDSRGRIGIRRAETTAASSVRYVKNFQVFDFSMTGDQESLFKTVQVYYGYSPTTGWQMVTKSNNTIAWKKNINALLADVYTYLTTAADATAVADALIALVDKDYIEFTTTANLFCCQAGDLIKFSRNRYYNLNGTANELTLRILKISKNLAGLRTHVTAEVV
jgi:hypothetical protein